MLKMCCTMGFNLNGVSYFISTLFTLLFFHSIPMGTFPFSPLFPELSLTDETFPDHFGS